MNITGRHLVSLYGEIDPTFDISDSTMSSGIALDHAVTTVDHMIITDNNSILTNHSSDAVLPVLKQPVYMIVIYSVAYLAVFCSGVVGNVLVVSVVHRNHRMHNVTNLFIVNLAIADILVCIFCLPITLLSNIFTGEFRLNCIVTILYIHIVCTYIISNYFVFHSFYLKNVKYIFIYLFIKILETCETYHTGLYEFVIKHDIHYYYFKCSFC